MKTEKALGILLWSKGIFLHISGELKNWFIEKYSSYLYQNAYNNA